MGRRIDVDDLVSAEEIAARAGVTSGQAVHNWAARHPDFPPPVRQWGNKRIWVWPDVARWLTATGRLPDQPKRRGRRR